MRKRLREQVSSVLRGMTAALLALMVLFALAPAAPALALAAENGAGVEDCCIVPPPSCDGPGAACAQQLCKADSLAAVEYAQTPGFTAAIPETHWRERVVTLPEPVAKPGLPVAQSGPPAYLRFHRFLL
jgi:uncharacterized membrane protein